MTIGEYVRAIEAKSRIDKRRLQERAVMDYLLADLVGISVARSQSSSVKMPDVRKHYSFLFDEDDRQAALEEEQRKRDEISSINFKLFANSFNARHFKEV